MFNFLSAVGNLSIIIGALAIIAALICSIYWQVNKIYDRRDLSRRETWRNHIASELDSIDKWCGYEFPELASLARVLIPVVKDEKGFDVASYRQEMRRMPRKFILSIDERRDCWIELNEDDGIFETSIKLRALADDLENKAMQLQMRQHGNTPLKISRIALSFGADGIVS